MFKPLGLCYNHVLLDSESWFFDDGKSRGVSSCSALIEGVEEFRTRLAGECLIDSACPSGCSCEGTLVDCSARGLKDIPKDIPMYTTELWALLSVLKFDTKLILETVDEWANQIKE